MTLSSLVIIICVIILCSSPNEYQKKVSLLVSGQFQDAYDPVGEHQVALTSDMINILLEVLSPECKTGLEKAMRSNGRYEISDDCKLELRTELVQADMVPPHLETEFMTNLNNHNANSHHGGRGGGYHQHGSNNNNPRGGHHNNKKFSKQNHHLHQNQYAFDYKNNPILQVLFHPIVAIIMFLIFLIVSATYAIIFVNTEMKNRGFNLYSKPKKLSKKKEEKLRSKAQISVIR